MRALLNLLKRWRLKMTIEEQIAALVGSVATLTQQVETVATSVDALIKAGTAAQAPVIDLNALEASIENAVQLQLNVVAEQISALATTVQSIPGSLQEILADITVQPAAAVG